MSARLAAAGLALAGALQGTASAPAASAPASAPASRPTTKELLARMAAAYARCSTFADEGTVVEVSEDEEGGKRTAKTPFTIRFARPGRLRFELRERHVLSSEEWDVSAFWSEGPKSFRWTTLSGLQEREPFDPYLRLPRTLADAIPALLEPGRYAGSQFVRMTRRKSARPDVVGGRSCWTFRGTILKDRELELTLDAETSLVRRAVSRWTLGNTRIVETTEFTPRADVAVPDRELAFTPPERPKPPVRRRHRGGVAEGPEPEPGPGEKRIDERRLGEPRPLPAADDPQHVKAKRLLLQMAGTYASCATYADTGEEIQTLIDPDGARSTQTDTFETRFSRTGRFYYEARDRRGEEEWDRTVIWGDGDHASRWDSDKNRTEDIAGGIARAADHASWNCSEVPQWLMRRTKSLATVDPATVRKTGSDEVEGHLCSVVEGEDSYGNAITLWIDVETSMLRKVLEEGYSHTFFSETTRVWRHRVDLELKPEAFDFEPPKR